MKEFSDFKNKFEAMECKFERLTRENERLTNLLSVNQGRLKEIGKALKKARHDNERYQNKIDSLQKFIGDNYKLVSKSE
jgi:predicted nuclease with TOPRIM domain